MGALSVSWTQYQRAWRPGAKAVEEAVEVHDADASAGIHVAADAALEGRQEEVQVRDATQPVVVEIAVAGVSEAVGVGIGPPAGPGSGPGETPPRAL